MISHEQLKPSRILSAKVDLPLPLPPHIPTIIICILRFINSVSRIFFRRSEAFGIQPSRTAWWSEARDADMAGCAELICIHSLPENWRKGCGRAMMERVLADVKKAGYETLVLWVFEKNTRAIRFYESFGFVPSGKKRPSLGAVEEMYCKAL